MSSSDELDVKTFYPNQYKPRVILADHPSQTRNIRNLLVGVYSKHRHSGYPPPPFFPGASLAMKQRHDTLSVLFFLTSLGSKVAAWPCGGKKIGYLGLKVESGVMTTAIAWHGLGLARA
jgi:hypothetical protein